MPIPLDLIFQNSPGAIACYLLPHAHGVALVECGAGSTLPALQAALAKHGFSVQAITDVFLTHIHLDHAGASGWLARQGARIHVHPVGAPHLLDPSKLLASARRIYGEEMDTLWGEFLPIPQEKLSVLHDGDVVEVGGLTLTALDTPGHANHHIVYRLDDLLFTGDIGGIRLNCARHICLPTPPPEFHLETWKQSIRYLQSQRPSRVALTHFGICSDADWHLEAVARLLDRLEVWLAAVMPSYPDSESLRRQFTEWETTRAVESGLDDPVIQLYTAANPIAMSADGLLRYWRKYRS